MRSVATKLSGARAKTVAACPTLDELQAGHIRHIDNISRQLTNDWRFMMGAKPMQEDYGAYRYQLAYMFYALALAHYHRLPAAPGVFKGIMERLIEKMLHPEVWLYWRDSSTGRGRLTFDAQRLNSEVNPVARDNIMYSAYVQTMVLLYTMLFDDRRYEKSGALTFAFEPMLWGADLHETHPYDVKTLNDTIYWNMVANGYLGVACEPYCVFQICNQVPILGFKLHDHTYGGDVAREVTEGYLKAWEEFGGSLDQEGRFSTLVVTHRKELIPGHFAWSDGWCGMLMNMWRPAMVREVYARVRDRWCVRGDAGMISVPLPPPVRPDGPRHDTGDFGWMAGWCSEMGDQETLAGLFAHADAFMSPAWDDGGLFYPRNDVLFDKKGNLTAVNPTTGNALLAYARLNVGDGLRSIYENPWTDVQRSQPAITFVSDRVDVRCASYDARSRQLTATFRNRKGVRGRGEVVVERVWGRKDWSLELDGDVVVQASGELVRSESGISARREGDGVRLSFPLNRGCDLLMTWE